MLIIDCIRYLMNYLRKEEEIYDCGDSNAQGAFIEMAGRT